MSLTPDVMFFQWNKNKKVYCIVIYCTALYCIVLYCIVSYCIALYWIALDLLYCIAMCHEWNVPHNRNGWLGVKNQLFIYLSFLLTPGLCQGQYTNRILRRWMSNIDICQSGLPIPLLTFCSRLIESVRMMECVV